MSRSLPGLQAWVHRMPANPSSPSSSIASPVSACSPSAVPVCPTPLHATNEDLCLLAKKSQAMFPGSYICALGGTITMEVYGVFRADTHIANLCAYSLADILRNRYPVKLFYRYRLSPAYNIARAFFRLSVTPRLSENSLSSTIHLPVSSNGHTLLYDKAFLISDFHHA